MAQFVFDSLNKTEVDTGDAFHPATGGEHSSVIVKAGGEVLVDAHGNAMLLDDATWDITVDGYVEVFGGNGNSNGIYLKLFGRSDVSNITVGHGGWVVGADRGIFSWHAANVTKSRPYRRRDWHRRLGVGRVHHRKIPASSSAPTSLA